MTPTTTDELIPDWTFDRTTPDLIAVLEAAVTKVAAAQWLEQERDIDQEEVDRLIAWLESDDSLDWEAVSRARHHGW